MRVKLCHFLLDALTKMAPPNAIQSDALAKKRVRHAKRRLKEMRLTVPDLPDTVIERCNLRHLSYAVKRCRGGTQSVLPLPTLQLSSPENSASSSSLGQ